MELSRYLAIFYDDIYVAQLPNDDDTFQWACDLARSDMKIEFIER